MKIHCIHTTLSKAKVGDAINSILVMFPQDARLPAEMRLTPAAFTRILVSNPHVENLPCVKYTALKIWYDMDFTKGSQVSLRVDWEINFSD